MPSGKHPRSGKELLQIVSGHPDDPGEEHVKEHGLYLVPADGDGLRTLGFASVADVIAFIVVVERSGSRRTPVASWEISPFALTLKVGNIDVLAITKRINESCRSSPIWGQGW